MRSKTSKKMVKHFIRIRSIKIFEAHIERTSEHSSRHKFKIHHEMTQFTLPLVNNIL